MRRFDVLQCRHGQQRLHFVPPYLHEQQRHEHRSFAIPRAGSTSLPASGSAADLRAISSLDSTVTLADASTVAVKGLTLGQPPTQAVGGALNSTLSLALPTPLAPGASVNVDLVFGVKTDGNYQFSVAAETLPATGSQVWSFSGNSEPPPASIAPLSLTFAGQAVNSYSSSLFTNVTNNNSEAIGVGAVTASGDFRVSLNACGAVIAPHSTCTSLRELSAYS